MHDCQILIAIPILVIIGYIIGVQMNVILGAERPDHWSKPAAGIWFST